MNAASMIAGWKQRLIALAENSPYVFRDTPQPLIDQHQQRMIMFLGYSESEVAAAEARLRAQFPAVFRQYLLEMAKSPGDLFRGSNLACINDFEQFRSDALALMAETDPSLSLPAEAVVFLFHHGYQFVYVLAAGGFDGPPMQWTEMHREPWQVADTFADMVDAELELMERNSRGPRETGGAYLTLYPDDGATQSYPALAGGERPLDEAPRAKRWWQFWR